MKTLTVRQPPPLFMGLHAYHTYASLAMSCIPAALASAAGDGIRKLLLAETWVHPDFCRREERWSIAGLPISDEGNPEVPMVAYYAKDGSYIGDHDTASYLMELGIAPQRKRGDLSVASIGFAESTQKWYGWSHRALSGFGVGDRFHYANQFWSDSKEPSDLVIDSLTLAKESAVNFSDDVS